MKTTRHALWIACGMSVVCAVGSATANEPGVVIGQDTLRAEAASIEIPTRADGADKSVRQVRFGVEDADVEVRSIVLHWSNHHDDTLTDVGVIRKDAQTAPTPAPDGRARLASATVHYRILGNRKDATFQVWGDR